MLLNLFQLKFLNFSWQEKILEKTESKQQKMVWWLVLLPYSKTVLGLNPLTDWGLSLGNLNVCPRPAWVFLQVLCNETAMVCVLSPLRVGLLWQLNFHFLKHEIELNLSYLFYVHTLLCIFLINAPRLKINPGVIFSSNICVGYFWKHNTVTYKTC